LNGLSTTGQPTLLKYYLVAYNLLNAIGWSYILIATLTHVFALDQKPGQFHALGWVDRPTGYPDWAVYLEKHVLPLGSMHTLRRMSTTGQTLALPTTFVQTLAVMEVVHSLLGWVRSPLVTVLMQVASRYYAIYGVNYLFPHVCPSTILTHPRLLT
jgi:very-long-chain (3R)-3-hydroxyacyl-CoA dehydratase